MRLALESARSAFCTEDVPVGALVVRNGVLVSQCANQREAHQDPTAHAEMAALRAASQALKDWNLSNCTLYVTLEPCPMCMGAILLSRIPRVVCGARNLKLGAAGTVLPLHDFPGLSLRCQVEHGVLEESCVQLLQEFFRQQRISGEVAEPG